MSSSELNSTEPPSSVTASLEELSDRGGGGAFLLPWLVGMLASTTDPNDNSTRDVMVFVNEARRSVTLIEGPPDVDLLNPKSGPRAASKASIESMAVVKVFDPGMECTICLNEFEVGEEVKEMPCKHKFHSGCIDKWLGIHGSCPVCRLELPVEEEEDKGEREMGGFRVRMFFARERETGERETGSGQESGAGIGGEESADGGNGNEGLPTQQDMMEIDR